jgi:hypothetical protein
MVTAVSTRGDYALLPWYRMAVRNQLTTNLDQIDPAAGRRAGQDRPRARDINPALPVVDRCADRGRGRDDRAPELLRWPRG